MPIPLTGGLLSGEVRDGVGKPITGAGVTVFDGASKRVAHTDTDVYGFFAAAVQPGAYRIQAEAGGYRTVYEHADVQWGTHRALGQITLALDEALTAPTPGTYLIDPVHSSVRFVARHIAMSRVYGQFREFSGQIRIEPRFEDSHADVLIEAASVYTNNPERDAHLRSPDFLDVERFPQLQFSSHRFLPPRRQPLADRRAAEPPRHGRRRPARHHLPGHAGVEQGARRAVAPPPSCIASTSR